MKMVAAFSPLRRTPISDTQFELALRAVDESPIVPMLNRWQAEDARGLGGRPSLVDFRAFMVGMALTVIQERAPVLTEVTAVLYGQLTADQRAELGIRAVAVDAEGYPDLEDYNRAYQSVLSANHRLFRLLEPRPFTKGHRHTKRQRQEIVDSADLPTSLMRAERLHVILNDIVESSIRCMRRPARRALKKHWKGSLTVDATPLRSHSGKPSAISRKGWLDPTADWYVREDPKKNNTKIFLAHEITIARVANDTPGKPRKYPMPALGLAIHAPGSQPGLNGALTIQSMWERGHPTDGFLISDQSYQPNSETFYEHIRGMGYTSVFSYGLNSAGEQGNYEGVIVVDGQLYCEGMPQEYRDATLMRRRGEISLERYHKILKAREMYLMRPDRRSSDGRSTAYICPSAGPAPTAVCDNRPRGPMPVKIGKKPLRQIANPPTIPTKACTNTRSISIPNDWMDRYRQPLPYGSEEWAKAWNLRPSIEAHNSHLKDPIRNALSVKGRIRAVGLMATGLAAAWTIFSVNLRYGEIWVSRSKPGPDGEYCLKNEDDPDKGPFDPALPRVKNRESLLQQVAEALLRILPIADRKREADKSPP